MGYVEDLMQRYVDAKEAFRNCPEMCKSFGISLEGQQISDRFFKTRDELFQLGINLARLADTELEEAIYRWAVWQQAASHTAKLSLLNLTDDSSLIMSRLSIAETDMLLTYEEVKNESS